MKNKSILVASAVIITLVSGIDVNASSQNEMRQAASWNDTIANCRRDMNSMSEQKQQVWESTDKLELEKNKIVRIESDSGQSQAIITISRDLNPESPLGAALMRWLLNPKKSVASIAIESKESFADEMGILLSILSIGIPVVLDFSNRKLSSEDITSLSPICNGNVAELNFYGNKIGNEEAKAVAEVVSSCPNLRVLKLNNNEIGDEGIKTLAPAIANCHDLTDLILTLNKIKDDGATSLSKVISQCTKLKSFGIGSNNIGNTGITALADAIATLPELSELFLLGTRISDAKPVNKILSNKNLRTLDLSGSFGRTELITIANDMRSNHTLTCIFLNPLADKKLAKLIYNCVDINEKIVAAEGNSEEQRKLIAEKNALIDKTLEARPE